jgi:lipopolysaccharide biosynthesis glycosyltransferase
MESDKPLYKIFIGYDSREPIASSVCEHSIKKRTKSQLQITHVKHRDLRKSGRFSRPWVTIGSTGEWLDLIDGKPFTTEFSHTRFLVPALNEYKGWALFLDADMIFLSDVKKLFELADDKYAVMCVKHNHIVDGRTKKMDDREQLPYQRKNWSSFVLWNCGHPLNRKLTEDKVNKLRGVDMHTFSWLPDSAIGSLPYSYNFIAGVSPIVENIDVLHYTEGGPWFDDKKDVPYADLWLDEYENYMESSDAVHEVIR